MGTFNFAAFRVRYLDEFHNGWFFPFTHDFTSGVWRSFAIPFDPTWSDANATAAGWIQESASASFAETFAHVFHPEIRMDGNGAPLTAGIDNFRIRAAGGCVSNLAEANTVDFSAMPPPNFSAASSFTTAAVRATLNSLTLKIHSNNASGSVGVRLRADNGGQPGALIEDLGIKPVPAGASLQTFPSIGTSLTANTTYWVTAGEAGSGSVTWEGTSSTAQTSPDGWTIGDQCFNTSDGTNWNPTFFGPPTESSLFSVNDCSGTVDVGNPSAVRGTLQLSAAVPNPFLLSTRIDYSLPTAGLVRLTVHDLQGRRVATLRDEELQAGRHSSTWDGHTADGGDVRAGIYFVRLAARGAAGTEVKLRTIVLMR